LPFKSPISNLKFTACALCCLLFASAVAWADELRLRNGTVLQVDEMWERNDEVWYRQGQLIRSIPAAEVLRGKELAAATEAASTLPKSLPGKKSARRAQRQAETPTATPPVTPPVKPDPNAKPITRIIFKDGVQLDADAAWEIGDRIGYRLGTMQTFIDKAAVARVLKDYVPPAAEAVNTPPPFNFTTRHSGLDQLIAANAERHGVDPLLIYLVMQQESGFNYRAVSRVGARGLMQLMPGTARRLGVRNIHDPVENVEAGTRYLKNLMQMFAGDINLALAAYNAGENAVIRYGNRVPPYRETINYVRRISWAYHQHRK
jgi:soluble lytic murein transglycosylase-like protein